MRGAVDRVTLDCRIRLVRLLTHYYLMRSSFSSLPGSRVEEIVHRCKRHFKVRCSLFLFAVCWTPKRILTSHRTYGTMGQMGLWEPGTVNPERRTAFTPHPNSALLLTPRSACGLL